MSLPGIEANLSPGKDTGAAPVLAATATASGSNSGGLTANLPAGITAGQLLLLLVGIGRNATTDVVTPSGWSPMFNVIGPGNMKRLAGFFKIATGSEGSTVGLSFTNACESAAISCRITGHTSGLLAWSGGATGTGASADPPSVDAGFWKDALDLAVCSHNTSGSAPTPPSGYGTQVSAVQSGGSSVRVSCARTTTDDTIVDPGAFALSASLNWAAATVVVG